MIRKKDYAQFVALLGMMGECTPSGQPSPEKIEMYFLALQDLEFEEVKDAAKKHLMTNKWFPAICELRGQSELDLELQSQKDYAILEHLADAFLFPGFAEAGMVAIEQKLTEKKRLDLLPVAKRFCPEISQGMNPSATRAQCIKSIKAEMAPGGRRAIQGRQSGQISERAAKMLGNIGKKM